MPANAIRRLQNYTFLPLRLTLGIVFLMHGYAMLNQSVLLDWQHLAPSFVYLFCGLAIVLGFFTRVAALAMSLMLFYWMVRFHFSQGFFVRNGGYEYHLVLFTSTFTLIHLETGKASIETYFGFR